ncbi:PD-(D/E)XK nuclease family protein [Psychrobacter sp. Ps6]|uniref:PD-(D/E)XK nuclease family protein n=1 Tax=Psychrobacter sp. Ps6 TaxID=2790960 RepID=UPI001EDF1DD3|nr:PD-(D/E)XK nuclease family protein [Psychrobacter sp. Ps6]MCG3880120.1 PD-(D/E)XK nuclease family protein [Psychrobacter sp. Ps6]
MTTPNLFKFATSELSQDAFICWLLSWADKDYQIGSDKHKALNKIATSVLALFFDKANKSLPSHIDEIVVKRQVNNIDVLCIINDTYCVLIEDKVGSIQHSNQLVRYKQFMINDHKVTFTEDEIIPIYLQTHDQSNYKAVLKDGFYPVTRRDLLDLFNSEQNAALQESDIYSDYLNHLQSIEEAVQSFQSKPVKEWKKRAWIGFFQHLQSYLGEGNWKYVANKSGGFMGFWAFKKTVDDIAIYLLLEQDKVCFKVSVPNIKGRSKIRNELYKLFKTEASKFDLKVSKPKRFGSGKDMTFAVLDTDIFDGENFIDIQQVNRLMDEVQKFINHTISQYKNKNE